MPLFPTGKLYIDGEIRPAREGKLYDDIGPWPGDVIAQAADASAEDVDDAIGAARRVFDTTDWSLDRDFRFGMGREWGREGIEGFCEMKLVGTRVPA